MDERELREKLKEEFPDFYQLIYLKYSKVFYIHDVINFIDNAVLDRDIRGEINLRYTVAYLNDVITVDDLKKQAGMVTKRYNELVYMFLRENRENMDLWCKQIELSML